MKVTFYGHGCFGVQAGETHLLFDPFISGNPKASHIDLNIVPADFILLTHGHQDHVLDVKPIAERTGAKLISNFEVITWFEKNGVGNGHPMNHGGKWAFNFGTVKYVNAVHSSSMPDGSYGGNPGGFVVETEEKCFYFSGDTSLTYDMKLIASSHKLDFAMLCLGDNFTMDYKDAAIAADFIGCSQVIGMHFDTFGFIEIDKNAAIEHFKQQDKTLHLMEIGTSMEL